MNSIAHPESHLCPACGTVNDFDALTQREYRCSQCNLELAHLDIAANGVIRGVFGWLHAEGDVIEGRYRVKSVLGKGGFGATYLVEDVRLNGKHRALKEVPALLFDEYETTLLSRLNHPSIPDIIDRFEADAMIYLVLEFGGSRTLGGERKQYPQQRIPQAKLLPWMRQLCEVLIYLHAQKPPIIHRDLKPDNILLDENGRIMLIDFGIAKESKPATMTRTLGRAATHGFSPPEQAMGTGTDERSDIYSLAATFYALLTAENPPAAHERVAGKELTPPSQLVPCISPQVEAAILQALNLNVNRRQQSVLEFSHALDGIDAGGGPHTFSNTQYSERTVMVGNASGSTAIHPPSIKLPSERITATKPEPADEAASVQKYSKRNLIILVTGVTITIAVLLTASYLFWPKSTPAPELKPPTSDKGLKDGDKQPIEKPTRGSRELPPIKPDDRPDQQSKIKGGGSALIELEKRLEKSGNTDQPIKEDIKDTADADLAKQKAENEARIKAEEDRKRREAERKAEIKRKLREEKIRAEERRKRLEAEKIAERNKKENKTPSWLDKFSGSQIRVK